MNYIVHPGYLVSISHLETSRLGLIRWTTYILTCFSNARHTLMWEWEWWGPWRAPGQVLQPRLRLKCTKGSNYDGEEWRLPTSAFKGFYLKKYHKHYLRSEAGHELVTSEVFMDMWKFVALFDSLCITLKLFHSSFTRTMTENDW